jgi:hypothetical protein
MSTDTNRREFLKSSTILCASAPFALSVSDVAYATAFAASNEIGLPSSSLENPSLLRALGSRIGLEAAQRVAPNGEAVSLIYFDGAGENLDALREGIEQGLAWQCDTRVAVNEVSVPYSAMLGVAIVRNLETAVETRVEIDATALSELAMIEANSRSASVQKHSVMSAAAENFYRVADLNA